MTKKEIRNNLKKQRNLLTEEEHDRLSYSIRENLIQTDAYVRCEALLTYVSFQSEVDTIGIIKNSFSKGKKVYLPRIEADQMEFYQILDLKDLEQNKYGIPEPLAKEENKLNTKYGHLSSKSRNDEKPCSDKILILLPGLAFDLSGNRIGYGAGYYDKYFVTHQSLELYKIALAFDFQVMKQIPAEDFDVKANEIITPTRNIVCNAWRQNGG